jgi:3-methyladenine DNA glycosylase Mpg
MDAEIAELESYAQSSDRAAMSAEERANRIRAAREQEAAATEQAA